jgi:elongation factor 1-beta
MADVVVTMKVMPDSPERDLKKMQAEIDKVILKFGRIYKKGIQPIAFGLNAMTYSFIMVEKQGGTDPVEEETKKIEGVSDVQITDVTRSVDVRDL